MDIVQEWLNLVEITYTLGTVGINWQQVMEVVREDDRFWYDTDHEGIKKSAGWKFLSLEDDEENEEGGEGASEEEDSEYASDEDSSEDESEGALKLLFFANPDVINFTDAS